MVKGTGKMKWSKLKIVVSVFIVFSLILITAGCGKSSNSSSGKTDQIVIATKGFAESDILANMIKLLIENNTKLTTKIEKLDNNLLWNAVKTGKVDTYVEYTGTALINILKQKPIYDANKSYKTVSRQLEDKFKLKALNPIGFNDTYALILKKDKAKKLGITDISQLAKKSGQLTLGASEEYLKRPDSWPILKKTYNLNFKEIKSIQDKSLQYKAAQQNIIDSMIAYSTDSQIPSSGMVVIKDNKHVFLPYHAFPLIRDSVLKKHPELKGIINKLSGKISDSEMQKLNGEVELKKRPALDVAKEWLKDNGLIK